MSGMMSGTRLALLGCCLMQGGLACSSPDPVEDPAAELASVRLPVLSDGQLDLSGGPIFVLPLPTLSGGSLEVIRVPDGFMTVSSQQYLAEKVILGMRSALYHSADGVDWRKIPLPLDGNGITLTGLAYGAGHFVMLDPRHGDVWHSTDGKDWTQTSAGLPSGSEWRDVHYVGERFIADGFTVFGVSIDGVSWQQVQGKLPQTTGIAHGNGLYMLAGSGGLGRSPDARAWSWSAADCELPEACIPLPGGELHPYLKSLVFAEDRFYSSTLGSEDGVDWEAAAPLPVDAYIDGHFFHFDGESLFAWTAGNDPQALELAFPDLEGQDHASLLGPVGLEEPLPGQVSSPLAEDVSCETAACFILDGKLLLVPPPGKP